MAGGMFLYTLSIGVDVFIFVIPELGLKRSEKGWRCGLYRPGKTVVITLLLCSSEEQEIVGS